MKTASRVLLSCAVVIGAAACGQKGPLYLPDEAGEVITRPAGEQSETPSETVPQPGTTPPPQESGTADKTKKQP